MKKFIKQLENYKWLIIIIALATIIRFGYLFVINPPITWDDAGIYNKIAWNLVNGAGYSEESGFPSASREPGYILFVLTPLFILFGHNFLAVQILQFIFNILAIILLYKLVLHYTSPRMALISSFLMAVHYSSIIYIGEILTENFFQFILLLSIFVLFFAIENQSKIYFLFSGLLLGMATLTRFNTALIFIAIFFSLLIIIKSWRKCILYSSLVGLGIAVMITPWIIRNYIQFNEFIPGRTGGGAIIWAGSYIPWDGDWLYSPTNYKLFSDKIEGLSSVERDRLFYKYAFNNAEENPAGVAWLWAKKPFKILLKDELADYLYPEKILSYDKISFIEKNKILFSTARIFLQLMHLSIIILAFIGAFILYRYKYSFTVILLFIIGYFLCSYIPMNATSRYLVPLLPFLFIFNAVSISSFIDFIRNKTLFNTDLNNAQKKV